MAKSVLTVAMDYRVHGLRSAKAFLFLFLFSNPGGKKEIMYGTDGKLLLQPEAETELWWV